MGGPGPHTQGLCPVASPPRALIDCGHLLTDLRLLSQQTPLPAHTNFKNFRTLLYFFLPLPSRLQARGQIPLHFANTDVETQKGSFYAVARQLPRDLGLCSQSDLQACPYHDVLPINLIQVLPYRESDWNLATVTTETRQPVLPILILRQTCRIIMVDGMFVVKYRTYKK